MLGEINNVTSDKNSEKGAEESGAPNPHSRRPSHDETDMRPVSQPGEIIFMETPQNMPMEGNGVPGPCPRKPPLGALFLSYLYTRAVGPKCSCRLPRLYS